VGRCDDGDAWDLPRSWLQHTPFDEWVLPGLALLAFVGIGLLTASAAIVFRVQHARDLSLLAGGGLCAWIVVQLAWLRMIHPVVQPTIFVAGVTIMLLAWRMPTSARQDVWPWLVQMGWGRGSPAERPRWLDGLGVDVGADR
jgi:hypothetical protein